ncbi:hypothetical protein [Chitinimonas taiwanensis]|uniref:hypothetical protein n=1 Tax=Chitinimonas taiwanensis TaxID=240412 RepID=UPI0035B45C77
MLYSVALAKISVLPFLVLIPHAALGGVAIFSAYSKLKGLSDPQEQKIKILFEITLKLTIGAAFIGFVLLSHTSAIGEVVECRNNLSNGNYKSVEGSLRKTRAYGKSGIQAIEFNVSGMKFPSSTGIFPKEADCGYLEQVVDIANTKDGDFVKIKYQNGKILELTKIE